MNDKASREQAMTIMENQLKERETEMVIPLLMVIVKKGIGVSGKS